MFGSSSYSIGLRELLTMKLNGGRKWPQVYMVPVAPLRGTSIIFKRAKNGWRAKISKLSIESVRGTMHYEANWL